MHRVLLTGPCLLFYMLASAWQDDSALIRKMADEILVNEKAYGNLHLLTKSVGPRLSGSPQTYLAEDWGQKTLREAGAEKVWLQACNIPHWVRGGRDEAALLDGNRKIPLEVLALGNSTGTGPEGITAQVMMVSSFEELDKRKEEAKGKIVFYNYKFNPRFIQTFRAYGDAVRYRGRGASQAAQYGSVAVIVRSMTASTDNSPHTGGMNYIGNSPHIPALAIGLWDADKLAVAVSGKDPVQVYLKTNAHTLPDTVGYNVIGEIRGTEFPDEYITVGGHLDSWDPAEGAQDDGAGCVQSIEVLRVFKAIGYQPRHSLRVVLFTDEENKGRGAAAYAQEAKAKNEKHLFGLESDAGGFTPRAFSVELPPEKLDRLRKWLPLLQPYGVYELTPGGGGADVEPLAGQLQVPVGELIPDSQRYFDIHHSRNDVFENVNKRELELGAINMAAFIYVVDKYGLQ
jgi:carboxypeptidase Q